MLPTITKYKRIIATSQSRKSIRVYLPMNGYWIFTATCSPVFKTARCTCARDAAPIGFSSISEKISSGETPRSSLITRATEEKGTGFALSYSIINDDCRITWQRDNVSDHSLGTPWSNVETICPNFT